MELATVFCGAVFLIYFWLPSKQNIHKPSAKNIQSLRIFLQKLSNFYKIIDQPDITELFSIFGIT
jgi:hypothetical protein